MPTPTPLAAQLAAYGATNTLAAPTTWVAVLRHLDPEGLRAIAATMPYTAIGKSLRGQLEALATERETTSLSLGRND